MKIYELIQNETILCNVVEFPNKKVAVQWVSKINSIVIYDSIDDFKEISLSNDRELLLIINFTTDENEMSTWDIDPLTEVRVYNKSLDE